MLLRLVVGLGNPGDAYRRTRHNFGFEVLDALASRSGESWQPCGFTDGLTVKVQDGLRLIKPMNFMNCSGDVVLACLNWWKIEVSEMLVVVDDVSLPLGRLRLRTQGSSGGHNGLVSLEKRCGTQSYLRLRGGVGQPEFPGQLPAFVLGKFNEQDWKMVEQTIERAVKTIELLQTSSLQSAMNYCNPDPETITRLTQAKSI